MPNPPSRPHLFGLLAGLFLATGLCLAAIILTRTWTHLHESQVIDVTGSARKNVRSDLVVWRCHFTVEDESLLLANGKLKTDLAKVEQFLRSRSLTDYTLAPVQIRDLTARSKPEEGETATRRIGFQLTQSIGVSSHDITGVQQLGRDCANSSTKASLSSPARSTSSTPRPGRRKSR